jgi:hypothetical protein
VIAEVVSNPDGNVMVLEFEPFNNAESGSGVEDKGGNQQLPLNEEFESLSFLGGGLRLGCNAILQKRY